VPDQGIDGDAGLSLAVDGTFGGPIQFDPNIDPNIDSVEHTCVSNVWRTTKRG
jgi:hypothetical protein